MIDYKNYDYQHVLIKKEKEANIIAYYKKFQWEEINRFDDKQYADIVHVFFQRKHKIVNKDRLQLLQVNMEVELNKIGRQEKNKHSKTIIVGLSLGILFCLVIGLSVSLAISIPTTLTISVSICICFLMLYLIFLLIIKMKKTFEIENQNCQKKIDWYTNNIHLICNQALEIIEVTNES